MTPFIRMQLRMLVPCVLPIPAGFILAWLDAFTQGLPLHLGLQTEPTMVPQMIFLGSVLLTTLLFGLQTLRIWRWLKGRSESCGQCGCLLGLPHKGPYGAYRPCLGCSEIRMIE